MSEIRDEVVKVARSFIGVPWHHQGRNPKHGLDCVGLLTGIASHFGWQHVIDGDLVGYSRYPVGDVLIENMDKLFTLQGRGSDTPFALGDILVYWIMNETFPQHVGIVTEIPTSDNEPPMQGFVHVYSRIGKVVEMPIGKLWKKRIHSVYSFPGVAEAEA